MDIIHATIAFVVMMIFDPVSGIRFLHGPDDVTVTEGQTATLRCRFQNKGSAPVYWWSTNQNRYLTSDTSFIEGEDSSRYTVAYNQQTGVYILQIPSTRLADAGEYKCAFAINSVVSARSATVTVVPRQVPPDPPVCSFTTTDQVKVGLEITLSCSSQVGNPPAQLTWLENGHPVTDPIPEHVLTRTFVVEPRHNGLRFTCRSTHPTFHAPMTCSLVPFHQIPQANIEPSIFRGVVGGTASFTCLASGVPPELEISWFVSSHPVDPSNPKFQITEEGRMLLITDLSLDDSKLSVSCRATNVNGLMSAIAEALLKVTLLPPTPTPTAETTVGIVTGDLSTSPPGLPDPEVSGSGAAESSSVVIIVVVIAAIIIGQLIFIALVFVVHRITNRMKNAKSMTSLDARVQEMNLDANDGGPNSVVSHSAATGGASSAAVGGNVYKSLHRYDTPNRAVTGTTGEELHQNAAIVDAFGYAATSKVNDRNTIASETSGYQGLPSSIPVYTANGETSTAVEGAGDYKSLHRYSTPNPAIEGTAAKDTNRHGATDTYGYTATSKLSDVDRFNSISSETSEYHGPPTDVPEYVTVPKGYQGVSREIPNGISASNIDEDSGYVLRDSNPLPDYASVPRIPRRNENLPTKELHDYDMVPHETDYGKNLSAELRDYDSVPDESLVYDIPSPRGSKLDVPIEKLTGYAVMRPSMSLE